MLIILFDSEARDLIYGLHACYNYDWTQISDSGSGIDLDNVARMKARAGLDMGQYMPYVTLGAAQAWTG
ncbi:hypothetical protein [Cognatiyoonia sp.]|uniref:hypothetical protein n=1 Tax=Cognatiyoonia sp. TaxID=2211652 RepID=UPI003F695214